MPFDGMNDEQIALLAAEDKKAADYLLVKYKPLVRARASTYYLIGGDRDDLIQEGMLGLFKAIRDYQPGKSNFLAFADLCITRQILSAVKAATRKKHSPLNSALSLQAAMEQGSRSLQESVAPDQSNDPQEMLIARQHYEAVMAALQAVLSKTESQVLALYASGLSYQEIARTLGRSEKSVDNALHRAKVKLGDLRSMDVDEP